MKKKYFFLFFLFFFLQFSFWPALFGLKFTPFFLLAFLVVLSNKMDFSKMLFWFFFGGWLVGYFSPWPPLTEALIFSSLAGVLFLLEKIFLWQRVGAFLESWLLLFSKLFFDGATFLLAKIQIWLKLETSVGLNIFVFREYLIELGLFIFFGLLIFFLLRDRDGRGRLYQPSGLIFQ